MNEKAWAWNGKAWIKEYTESKKRPSRPEGTDEVLKVLNRFREIEEKNRCLRVQFLDWLSAKLAVWSTKVKKMSDDIHSPCKIKI